MTSLDPIAEYEAQGTLHAGELGWWKIYGANVVDIKANDIVIDSVGAYFVFSVKGKTLTALVLDTSEGEICVGFLARIQIIRFGNSSALSDTCEDAEAHMRAYESIPEVPAETTAKDVETEPASEDVPASEDALASVPVPALGETVTFAISKTLSGIGTLVAIQADGTAVIRRRNGKTYRRPIREVIRSYHQNPM